MSNQISSSLPINIFWRVLIFIGLILGAWVVEQQLVKLGKLPAAVSSAPQKGASAVQFVKLPRFGQDSSVLDYINTQIASAKQEVLVAARVLNSASILKNLRDRETAGVPVFMLLSPDWLSTKTGTDVISVMQQSQMSGIYKDTMVSGSYIIIIDEKTVIISDLPFTKRAMEPSDEASIRASAWGYLTVIDDPAFAKGLAGSIKMRIQEQNKIL
jgi:phosphatidylserine/phosphatidylglycerophosphate/cardiolipin synthase-like enzyme